MAKSGNPVGAFDRVRAVLPGRGIDTAALEAWCSAELSGFAGPLEVAQFHGGASNPTYLLRDAGTGKRYVLRKQPPGPLLASAHAVDREYRVMKALGQTPVPVPRMLAYCSDSAVLGTPFYLMPFLEGRIYADNHLADMSPPERTAAYQAIAETLAALHRVDVAAAGLADFGRPGNYFARQIARWTRQYRDAETVHIPSMERLIVELPGRIPADDTSCLVHGDYRQENLMFAADAPRVIALLDWELSTLGHPLSDVAFFCLFYHADFKPWGSAATIDFAATGIPDEASFVASYCKAAGREGVDDWNFYLAFAAFRLASIAQGVFQRMSAVPGAADIKSETADWADLALALFHRPAA
jgi:aminoglycoside phosphotransferase (APT) family kinase protein